MREVEVKRKAWLTSMTKRLMGSPAEASGGRVGNPAKTGERAKGFAFKSTAKTEAGVAVVIKATSLSPCLSTMSMYAGKGLPTMKADFVTSPRMGEGEEVPTPLVQAGIPAKAA